MTSEPSTSSPPSIITITSSDGSEFEMSINLAQQSETLSNLITNFDYHRKDVKKESIPLENITGAQMEKVLKWLNRHRHASNWVPRGNDYVPNYKFDNWTAAYLNISNNQLFELMKAANYLNIPRLYDAVCRKVASKIAGKTADEMRQALNLRPDADAEKEADAMDGDEDSEEEEYKDEVMSEISLDESSDSEDEQK